MQFGDFVTCGFNQLVNNVATTRYRWGAAVPLVVRLPVGGGLGAGPFHSQNVEAWFCHVPGLKVVAPATADRRQGPAAGGTRRRQPRAGPRAQAAVPQRPGPGPGRPPRRALGAGPDRPAGHRCHGRDLRRRGRLGGRRRRRVGGRRRRRSRGDRPALAPPVGPRPGARLRAADLAGAGAARGGPDRGAGRRDRRHDRRRCVHWLDAPVRRVGGLDTPIPFAPDAGGGLVGRGPAAARARELLAF